MIKKMFNKIAQISIIFVILGCNQRDHISDYSKYLGVELSYDMEEINVNRDENVFDYSYKYIYSLTNQQRSKLEEILYFKVCDSNKRDCWKKYGEYYSYEISDSTDASGYYIKALLTGNELNTLIIREMKWK